MCWVLFCACLTAYEVVLFVKITAAAVFSTAATMFSSCYDCCGLVVLRLLQMKMYRASRGWTFGIETGCSTPATRADLQSTSPNWNHDYKVGLEIQSRIPKP